MPSFHPIVERRRNMLIAAAGGLPDEGEYDPRLDRPDYIHQDGTGIQSDR